MAVERSASVEPTGAQAGSVRRQEGAIHQQLEEVDKSGVLLVLFENIVEILTSEVNINGHAQAQVRKRLLVRVFA